MDTTFIDLIVLTSTCWIENYQPLTYGMTKVKYTGRYRLGLFPLFFPNTNLL